MAQVLGRNVTFTIYNADGTSFHGLVMKKSVSDSIVMSLGDKITGDVYYRSDDLQFTMKEYITYNGINYVLVNPPTIVKEGMSSDNSELKGMTKYSLTFYHPMYMLGNFPLRDVAVSNDEKQYLSEKRKFSWIGTPDDFIAKLNKNLQGTQWIVVKSDRFPQDLDDVLSQVLTFDENTIADGLKTMYDEWGVPYIIDQIKSGETYYSEGKRFKVVVGLPSNEIYASATDEQQNNPFVFEYGKGVGLKNNSRTPRNNKIVTRLSGFGSENNIPYGYPQIRWYGDTGRSFTYGDRTGVFTNVTIGGHTFAKIVSYPIYNGILGGAYVELIKHPFTREYLMPSVYRTTLFNKISFLNSDGTPNLNYDPDIELVDYYDAVSDAEHQYPNPINLQAPSFESHGFEDIKPELDPDGDYKLIAVTPLNNDLTPASGWVDDIDDDGNFLQSYFQITLPVLPFDIYACAAITEEMQINMRSGACIGCTFDVQVDWDDYKKNFYDDQGNFAPNGAQRNLTKYPKSNSGRITLILQKDNNTFGTLMPNIYQQPKGETTSGADDGDAFVVLGISLPDTYITDAESRLDEEMKSYMLENNVYYFDYPLKFDEHFLATHTHILSQIKPNTVVRFNYAGQNLELFVKQLTVKYGENVLPQYDITLTDNVEVTLNQIGQVADDVERLSSLIAILRQSYGRNVWTELNKKLSKVSDDTAQGFIRMLKGIQVGSVFDSGILGSGGVFRKDADGTIYIEADRLYIRMKAYFDSVEVREYIHSGGNRIASPAQGFKCSRVDWLDVNGNVLEQVNSNLPNVEKFRCYWRVDDGETKTDNQFVIGDLAFCQNAKVTNTSLNIKRFWRVVVDRDNGNNYDSENPNHHSLTEKGEAWIDISNAHNSDSTPKMTTITWAGQGGTPQSMSVLSFQAGSDIPSAEDDICMLGNVRDTTRRGAIIEYTSGEDSPSYKIYQGIGANASNPYSLEDKNYLGLGYDSSTGRAYLKVYGDARIGAREGESGGYIKYNQQYRTLEVNGRLNVGSTLADGRNVNALGTSNGNLLLNTSFTGDYDSEDVDTNTDVTPDTVIYSDPLKHWQAAGVTVIALSDSQSGYAAKIAGGGTLAQTVTLEEGKWYVLSFRGRGESLSYSIGGVTGSLALNPSAIDSYDVPFVCGINSGLTIIASSEVTIMELQLCEGNLPTAWKQNYSDGEKTMAAVNEYKYISDAIKNASTDIIGGLILSQIIKVGNYRNKNMTEETGGMSGAWLDDNSPFLWGGGDMSQAIYTIMKYANDPSYEPTQEEIEAMAKFVVTHGGRAILNDVILRGYIYALGGYFKGKITAESGEIAGDIIVGDVNDKNIVIKPSTNEGAAIVMKNGNVELMEMVFGTDGDNVWYPAIFVKHPNEPTFTRLDFSGIHSATSDSYEKTAHCGIGNISLSGVYNNKSIRTDLGIDTDGLVHLHAYDYTNLRHAWTDLAHAAYGDVYVDSNGFLKVKQ